MKIPTLGYEKTPLQMEDGTLIFMSRFYEKIWQGYGFAGYYIYPDVGADEYADFLLINPENSGRIINLVMVEVGTFARAHMYPYKNVKNISGGTSISITNLNFGSNITSIAQLLVDPTYSGGTELPPKVIGGGSGVRAIGAASIFGEAIIIPSGYNLLVRVQNKDTSASDISIGAIWWEETTG